MTPAQVAMLAIWRSLALRIGTGTSSGRVTWGIDPADWYAFQGEEGQWLRIALSPGLPIDAQVYPPPEEGALEGPIRLSFGAVDPGFNSTILLPFSGTWFVVFQPLEFGPNLAIPYEFDLRLERPDSWLFVAPEAKMTTMEFAWDEPARVVMEARLPVKNAPATAEATGMFFILQADVTPNLNPFLLTFFVGDQGFGRGVRVEPVGLSAELADPQFVEVQATELGGSILFPWENQQLTGRLRMTLLHTRGAEPSMYFSTDVPVKAALYESDDVVEWTEAVGPGELAVVAPGLSAASPRELELEASDRTLAYFNPWWHEGAVVEPSGAVHDLGPMDSARFYGGVQEGTWRLRLNAAVGAGPTAASPYLLAADVPHLGLGPELTRGFRIVRGEAPWEALLRGLGL